MKTNADAAIFPIERAFDKEVRFWLSKSGFGPAYIKCLYCYIQTYFFGQDLAIRFTI